MGKYDLVFDPPLMNAAGSLGYAPDPHGPVDPGLLGAFVTNPVSLRPRNPALGARHLPYPGGFLLHTGHPNPGLKAVIRRYRKRWSRSPRPVLVHLLAQGVDEVVRMVSQLEELAGAIAGLELGFPSQVGVEEAVAMAQSGVGELPVVLRLPLERAPELASAVAATVEVAAFSLGPPRGALSDPKGELVHGRLYGPALYPLALEALLAVKNTGIPVIGGVGVYQPEQVEEMLAAGASGVQLDAVLWRGGYFQ